ncbi:MAG: adenosylcobinamide-GDP ribazoletransferase [Candidatus Freyarchaeota archaeon]|nr:adenosylcobinamide-GDP ribazoletransferase [Candidatus Jordarchaeia archaeon]
MGVLRSLKLLLSFFTAIPVKGAGSLSEAAGHLALAPIVGAIYGLLAGFSLAGMELLLPPLPSAALTLLAVNALNRFLHMDGLVDFGDGLTALGGRGEKLNAMKDKHIGAGGASTALMVVAASIALYGSIPQWYALLSAFTVEVMCVNSMLACACAGKPRGSGLGNFFVENVGWKDLLASSLLSATLTSTLYAASARLISSASSYELAPLIPLSLATSLAAGLLVALLSNRVFGCVTGDVLGACHELSRIPLLAVALVVQLA